MEVSNNTVTLFHYRLSNAAGEEIESSEPSEPMAALIGHNNILFALEEAMKGKTKGEAFSVTLPPEKAYGHAKRGCQLSIY